jgi:hypothetical protein
MAIKYTKSGHKIYHPLSFKGPPKFTQSGIFGFKTKHLATLIPIADVYVAAL